MSSTRSPASSSTSSAPSTSFAYNLPPEITLMVAKHFSRSTLQVAVRVCKDWNRILSNLIWYEVLEMDWHHPSFPTRVPPYAQFQDLAVHFVHTRVFSWHSNKAISQRRITTKDFALSTQLPPAAVSRVLSLMSNLTSVELHLDSYPALSDFDDLKKLEKLELNMLNCSTPGFSVTLFADLFSRINCLKLVMPPETVEVSMSGLPETDPWVMTVLEIEPEAIPLASHCKKLKELAVGCDRDFEQVSMRPVMECQDLEILRINVDLMFFSGVAEVLPSLTNLKHLEIIVNSSAEIEFFNAPDTPMPLLEILEIKHMSHQDPGNISSFSRTYGTILRSHSNLRTFHVEGAAINPSLVFPVPGQERVASEWVCDQLEHLALILSWPGWSITSKDEKCQCWDEVFVQIGKLSHLKTVSIESEDLEVHPGRGFLEKCAPLYDLKSLVLSAPDTERAWRVDQIQSLLEKYPALRSIDLGGLVRGSGSTIQAWLDNECNREIDLVSFYNESDDEEYQESDCDEYEDDGYRDDGYRDDGYRDDDS
ncbi:hypothetical protein BGZ80_005503 [Entomortierella chlamydospora]|uniref:F-box domain-containing protein n=1 Tax=Entomortierella chlamydospora TaxID=101097 RepID=A0A9P6MZG6_9FUNG|nr:hypothetical protein BGZ80_005503 [Entomortierella chlamydospora]